MLNQFSRTELIFGKEAMQRLENSRVAVFGIGGVGGYTVEALARSGVGAIDLIDDDRICLTNINRQILATRENVGKYKVDEGERRILSINPACKVTKHKTFYLPETADQFDFHDFDYVVDAIDTVSAKIELIARAAQAGVPIVSAMGCGNRLDATKFVVTDLYKTQNDPLARVLRRELRRRGVERLRVVCSTAPALTPRPGGETKGTAGRPAPGSVSWVPGVAGMILAGEAVKIIAGIAEE